MAGRPKSDEAGARAQAQRERILAAAQQCFIEHGFHGASMASIAETAGMSAGLIYRYFENKAAIILAIVEHQLELLRQDIRLNQQIDLAAELVSHYGGGSADCKGGSRGMSAALLLEISAEATRDPQIAAALDHYDTTLRAALHEWMARPPEAGGHGTPADRVAARALMLQCLVEGLKMRETREPNLDRGLLEDALREVLPKLVAP